MTVAGKVVAPNLFGQQLTRGNACTPLLGGLALNALNAPATEHTASFEEAEWLLRILETVA